MLEVKCNLEEYMRFIVEYIFFLNIKIDCGESYYGNSTFVKWNNIIFDYH